MSDIREQDHRAWSEAQEPLEKLTDSTTAVIIAAIAELETELRERDPNYERRMKEAGR